MYVRAPYNSAVVEYSRSTGEVYLLLVELDDGENIHIYIYIYFVVWRGVRVLVSCACAEIEAPRAIAWSSVQQSRLLHAEEGSPQ